MVKKILKIIAFIVLPVIPLTIAAYFLYPYINEKGYQQVAKKYQNEVNIGDSVQVGNVGGEVKTIGEDFATLKERSKAFQKKITVLKSQVDSLSAVNDSLAKLLKNAPNATSTAGDSLTAGDTTTIEGAKKLATLSDKELADNVKSLLALDLEDLSPILNEMTNRQLLRLYKVGSSLERKKILRALESKRAAKLMTELM